MWKAIYKQSQARKKVRDHDHITGEYLGAACASCNIQRVLKNQFVPLFFHNGKNYDLHHIIKEITKEKVWLCFCRNTREFREDHVSYNKTL